MRDRAWRLLARGVKDRRHGFHDATLATTGSNALPRLRTVVLRIADDWTIGCHCDRRSTKATDVRRDPRVTWHVYDRKLKTQLVLTGRAVLHEDDALADERWAATGPGGRATYQRPHPPGTVVDEPWVDVESDHDGRRNFAVLVCAVDTLDHLFLHHAGHRRAVFERADGFAGRWVTP